MFTVGMIALVLIGFVILAVLVAALPTFLRDLRTDDIPTWSKTALPLYVEVDPDLVDVAPELIDALEAAILYWNSITGLLMYTATGKGKAPVRIKPMKSATQANPPPAHSLGWTESTVVNGARDSATIFIEASALKDVESETLAHVLEHELGHALGLRHDDFMGSVMCERFSGHDLMLMPRQAAIVKALYK